MTHIRTWWKTHPGTRLILLGMILLFGGNGNILGCGGGACQNVGEVIEEIATVVTISIISTDMGQYLQNMTIVNPNICGNILPPTGNTLQISFAAPIDPLSFSVANNIIYRGNISFGTPSFLSGNTVISIPFTVNPVIMTSQYSITITSTAVSPIVIINNPTTHTYLKGGAEINFYVRNYDGTSPLISSMTPGLSIPRTYDQYIALTGTPVDAQKVPTRSPLIIKFSELMGIVSVVPQRGSPLPGMGLTLPLQLNPPEISLKRQNMSNYTQFYNDSNQPFWPGVTYSLDFASCHSACENNCLLGSVDMSGMWLSPYNRGSANNSSCLYNSACEIALSKNDDIRTFTTALVRIDTPRYDRALPTWPFFPDYWYSTQGGSVGGIVPQQGVSSIEVSLETPQGTTVWGPLPATISPTLLNCCALQGGGGLLMVPGVTCPYQCGYVSWQRDISGPYWTGILDGNYWLRATASDGSYDRVPIGKDTVPPQVTISGVTPSCTPSQCSQNYVRGQFTVHISAQDSMSGVNSVWTVVTDGTRTVTRGGYFDQGSRTGWSFIDLSSWGEGTVITIQAFAMDRASNVGSSSVLQNYILDSAAPVVTVGFQPNISVVSTEVLVCVTLSSTLPGMDAGSGLGSVSINGVPTFAGTEPNSYCVAFSGLNQLSGTQMDVSVQVCDNVQNCMSQSATVTICRPPPDKFVHPEFDTFGEKVALAIDSLGYPHVVAQEGDALLYYYWDGTQWTSPIGSLGFLSPMFDAVAPGGAFGSNLSLALDAYGEVAVAYIKKAAGQAPQLKYAHHTSAGWVYDLVDTSFDPPTPFKVNDVSLAFDPTGTLPRISYQGETALKFAHKRADGTWGIELVDYIGGYANGLAIDNGDVPYIVYSPTIVPPGSESLTYIYWVGVLNYAHKQGTSDSVSGWTTEIVSQGGDAFIGGGHVSVQVGDDGIPHVSLFSYLDVENDVIGLYYLVRDGNPWRFEQIETWNQLHSVDLNDIWTSLSLYGIPAYDSVDARTQTKISYYDPGNKVLKLATQNLSPEAYCTTGIEGWCTHQNCEGSCIPFYVIFNQYPCCRGQWRVRFKPDGWTTEIVDAGAEVGRYNSLGLDGLGRPRLAYTNVREETTCLTELKPDNDFCDRTRNELAPTFKKVVRTELHYFQPDEALCFPCQYQSITDGEIMIKSLFYSAGALTPLNKEINRIIIAAFLRGEFGLMTIPYGGLFPPPQWINSLIDDCIIRCQAYRIIDCPSLCSASYLAEYKPLVLFVRNLYPTDDKEFHSLFINHDIYNSRVGVCLQGQQCNNPPQNFIAIEMDMSCVSKSNVMPLEICSPNRVDVDSLTLLLGGLNLSFIREANKPGVIRATTSIINGHMDGSVMEPVNFSYASNTQNGTVYLDFIPTVTSQGIHVTFTGSQLDSFISCGCTGFCSWGCKGEVCDNFEEGLKEKLPQLGAVLVSPLEEILSAMVSVPAGGTLEGIMIVPGVLTYRIRP